MQRPSGKLPSGDEKFLKNAAEDNKAEVELGKLASERASSPAVKQFAERMVNDHSKAYDEVVQLGQQKRVSVPAAPSAATALRRA